MAAGELARNTTRWLKTRADADSLGVDVLREIGVVTQSVADERERLSKTNDHSPFDPVPPGPRPLRWESPVGLSLT